MADVADGRLRADAGPGAPLPDAAGGPAKGYGFTRYHKETQRLYGVLDRRLAGRDYVATAGEPSIADFAILGWAWRHERHQVALDDLPNVAAWYDRMMARPATAKGFEVALS